ncbi:unnamed protein product, partial [Prorocentrum cordatum]
PVCILPEVPSHRAAHVLPRPMVWIVEGSPAPSFAAPWTAGPHAAAPHHSPARSSTPPRLQGYAGAAPVPPSAATAPAGGCSLQSRARTRPG